MVRAERLRARAISGGARGAPLDYDSLCLGGASRSGRARSSSSRRAQHGGRELAAGQIHPGQRLAQCVATVDGDPEPQAMTFCAAPRDARSTTSR